jgi:hypothetical protein
VYDTRNPLAVLAVLTLLSIPVLTGPASADSAEGTEAEDTDANAFLGAWVGVGGAFALENFEHRGSYEDSGTLSFRAGYRGLPNVAVELLGEVLPQFEANGAADGDLDGYIVTANGKLYLPLGRVEPWAMAGVGFLSIDPKHSKSHESIAFRFSSGFDVALTRHVSIYLEAAYVLPTGDVEDYAYSTYGAGVLFRF